MKPATRSRSGIPWLLELGDVLLFSFVTQMFYTAEDNTDWRSANGLCFFNLSVGLYHPDSIVALS